MIKYLLTETLVATIIILTYLYLGFEIAVITYIIISTTDQLKEAEE